MAQAVLEARGALLAATARLAAERRSGEQAKLLRSLAAQLAAEPDDDAAQGLDFAFYAVLVEAAVERLAAAQAARLLASLS